MRTSSFDGRGGRRDGRRDEDGGGKDGKDVTREEHRVLSQQTRSRFVVVGGSRRAGTRRGRPTSLALLYAHRRSGRAARRAAWGRAARGASANGKYGVPPRPGPSPPCRMRLPIRSCLIYLVMAARGRPGPRTHTETLHERTDAEGRLPLSSGRNGTSFKLRTTSAAGLTRNGRRQKSSPGPVGPVDAGARCGWRVPGVQGAGQ